MKQAILVFLAVSCAVSAIAWWLLYGSKRGERRALRKATGRSTLVIVIGVAAAALILGTGLFLSINPVKVF